MAGVNKVILVGNLGADPEMKYTPNGTAICRLRVATTKKWTDKEGARQEKTEWHSVTFWRKVAEICGLYLHKGMQVYIEGSLQNDVYEKDGQKRYTYNIQGRTMQMLGGASGNNRGHTQSESSPEENAARDGVSAEPEEQEDIPF